jgi:ABC-2 type transport system permease protein
MVPLVLSFQRCIYAHPTVYGKVNGQLMKFLVLPEKGMLWYVGLDLAVLFLAVCLFLVALSVFGRLEGNFAEEL